MFGGKEGPPLRLPNNWGQYHLDGGNESNQPPIQLTHPLDDLRTGSSPEVFGPSPVSSAIGKPDTTL